VKDDRTVALSWSSELPCDREFGWEVLSHERGHCDLSRLNSGAALLVNHNENDQVGVVESAEIGPDRIGRAIVRFGTSQRAEEIYQDVKSGIRRLASVGYKIRGGKPDGEKDGKRKFLITDWIPGEISIVPIPVDPKIGVGRAQDNNMKKIQILLDPDPAGAGGGGGAATPPRIVEITPDQARAQEKARCKDILTIGHLHKRSEDAQKFIDEGKTADQFRSFVLESYGAKQVDIADPVIGMSDKEIKRYSLVRALNLLASKKALDGLEKEASDAVETLTRKQPQGFYVPHDIATRSFGQSKGLSTAEVVALIAGIQQRALNATTATAGGFTVGTNLLASSMIELLRNNMVTAQLGARLLSGLVGNVAIPKHTGGATAYWLPESGTVTASQQTFGQLGLVPHRLAAATAYDKQLLMQSSIDVEGFVRQDLMAVLALEKDRAVINGLGNAGEPLGILNTTGVGSITYSAAPTWAKVVENETTLFAANVPLVNVAFLTSGATRGKWKSTVKVSGAAAGFLCEPNNVANNYPLIATTQMPSGDKTIFGNWSDLILADWDGLDVVVDPYSLSLSNQARIVINMHTDNGVRHPTSFVVSTDSAAQ